MVSDLAIFSGRSHPQLGGSICQHLEMPLGACDIFDFSNENIFVRIRRMSAAATCSSFSRSVRR